MSATMIARDLAAGHGDRTLFSGLDLVVAPGDVIGLVGVERRRQVHAAADPGRADAGRGRHGLAEPAHRDRRLPAAGARAAARRDGPRLPGPAHRRRPGAGGDGRRRRGAGRGRAGRRRRRTRPRWSAGSTSAAPTWTSAPSRSPPSWASPSTLDHPMTALSGGQAARAGLASLLLSRYDVFLLDEPTNDLDLDGLARLEEFVTGLRAGDGAGQPRPRVPGPHGHRGARAGPGPAAGHALRRRLRGLPGGARAGPAARPRGVRGVRRQRKEPAGAGPDAARLDGARASATPAARPPTTTRTSSTFRGETSEKQAAKARQTERLIERLEVVEEPRKEWELRMEIAAAPRAGAVVATLRDAVVRRGDFTLGPVDPADRLGRPGGDHRRERRPASRRCWPRCSAGCRWTRARPRSARAWWSARSTRRAGCSSATSR